MNDVPDAVADSIRRLAEQIRTDANQQIDLEGEGRGIVIVAGGSRVFTNAYVLLHVLRNVVGSTLPIELWYFGQGELSAAMAALVRPFGVTLVDAVPLIEATDSPIRDGWQLKSFALVHSRFAEVLLLDADQVPVDDPAACFHWPQYRETGAVFWPDIVDLRKDNAIWSLLGLEASRTASFESGQLLVDRRRHGAALVAALRLNEAADQIYHLVYGDKDTYLLAWHMLGVPYALVPHKPYADEFMLVQRDFDGNALFQHRTNAKWQYGTEQRKLFAFRHEAACIEALAELERRWSGRVFTAPDRSRAARDIEHALIGTERFALEVLGDEPIALALQPHAEIGEGRGADRRHWWVEQSGDDVQLVLSGGDQRSYVLSRQADGTWRGRRHRLPSAEAFLVPQGPAMPEHLPGTLPGLADDLLRTSGLLGQQGECGPGVLEALVLLARVLPGTRERIEYLAQAETDAATATRLRELAARLAPHEREEVDRSYDFEVGYIRSETPE